MVTKEEIESKFKQKQVQLQLREVLLPWMEDDAPNISNKLNFFKHTIDGHY